MYIKTTNSTNSLMKEMLAKGEWPEGERFLYTGYQTAGRGQTGNSWESEADKNLLCSILLPPRQNLFELNVAVSVAVHKLIRSVLCQAKPVCALSGEAGLSIKWPNDIYFGDKKVAGILIENAIIGNEIKYSIAGIGLNVNQTTFVSNAPNPVSLKQITGKEYDIERLMRLLFETVQSVLNEPEEAIWTYYKAHLYRREGFWPFEDKNGRFEAAIQNVLPTGEIILCDRQGNQRIYEFKQIRYVL
jgi:BirA family biotin operon repressor/biotin-[acetyl-CoA-carboxylase] ligase